METRELFERLVADEPPLSLGAAAASARGHQAARRRRGGFAAGGVSALVLAMIVAGAQLGRPDQRHGETLAPTAALTIASLPFTSVSQVNGANARVDALLVAAAGGTRTVIPTVRRSSTAMTAAVDNLVRHTSGDYEVVLESRVSTAAGMAAQYGPGSDETFCQRLVEHFPLLGACVGVMQRGGPSEFTFEQQELALNVTAGATPSPSEPYVRHAVLLAADGSGLELSESAVGGTDAGTPRRLGQGVELTSAQLWTLAQQSAHAWLATTVAATPQASFATTSQVASAVPSPAAASSPAGVASLPFLSAHQIAASNARVYGILVAYAGGAAVVTRGAPLWDTNPVTKATQFVGTQVQYRTSGGTGMVRVVTDTATEAKSRYGGLLNGDLCAELAGRSTDDGTFVDCRRQGLAGGGTLWTYSRKEATPGEISNRDPSSTLGPAVYEDDAIVVAKDGSTLDLLFQVLATEGGASAPLPLTDRTKPDLAALGGLALDAAATWQPHDADLAAAASGS